MACSAKDVTDPELVMTVDRTAVNGAGRLAAPSARDFEGQILMPGAASRLGHGGLPAFDRPCRASLSGDRRAAASGNGGEQKIKPRMQAICGKCPPHRLILGNKPGHGCVEAYVPSGCRFILHHPAPPRLGRGGDRGR